MEIIINGNPAALKKNTSFDYISENSMFTGSDSYTLSITFPLKDCPQNIAIFGNIYRQDVDKSKVVFDCDIRDREFFRSGSIIITQINETEVKTQFLEGRSEQNFNDSFDEIYINQMNLGYPSGLSPDTNDIYTSLWNCYPYVNWVPLPWVNNTSGNLQNAMTIAENGNLTWANNNMLLTFQPFLVYILKRICEQLGYTGNFSSIENSKWNYLLLCNTLPWTWYKHNFAVALPHWTLTEFFEELEKLMEGEFSINHKAKTINFEFSYMTAYRTKDVHIEEVINKYSVEVSQENKPDYVGAKNLAYADNDNRLWAYRSCEWYISEHKNEAKVFQTMPELLAFAKTLEKCGVEEINSGRRHMVSYSRGYPRGSDGHKLFYVVEEDMYFIMWCYKAEFVKEFDFEHDEFDSKYYEYTNRLEAVNQFGRRVVDKDADDVELNIVPAWIDDTDETLGKCLFLECGQMDSATVWTEETDEEGNTTTTSSGSVATGSGHFYGGTRSGGSYGGSRNTVYGEGTTSVDYDDTDYNNGAFPKTNTARAIAKGEQKKDDAYFDKIYVAFWDGYNRQTGKLPRPILDKVELIDGFKAKYPPYSLRINTHETTDAYGYPLKYTHEIDTKKKYTFSFFADEIPDPHALFYIEGGKYIAEKITATFHESTGKSQLLKGVFYRVTD